MKYLKTSKNIFEVFSKIKKKKYAKEICEDVKVEPMLCEIEKGEEMVKKSNNQAREARLDVSAVGFWTKGQRVFF